MIPKAIGPYASHRVVNGLVFTSGQLPLDPVSNKIVSDDVVIQTRQSLTNIDSIMKECGGSMNDIIKTTVLLSDINDFTKVNEEYAKFFKDPFPSRMAYEVAALPMGAKVEIEVIAFIK